MRKKIITYGSAGDNISRIGEKRRYLLDYNKRTFEKFMYDIEKEYRERVTANKKMRYEIEDLKMQVLETEKELASMKLDSSH